MSCNGRRVVTAAACPSSPLEDALGGLGRLAMAVGVHDRQILRWRHSGVTWATADVLAVRVGLHPSEVWGAAWWDAAGTP